MIFTRYFALLFLNSVLAVYSEIAYICIICNQVNPCIHSPFLGPTLWQATIICYVHYSDNHIIPDQSLRNHYGNESKAPPPLFGCVYHPVLFIGRITVCLWKFKAISPHLILPHGYKWWTCVEEYCKKRQTVRRRNDHRLSLEQGI